MNTLSKQIKKEWKEIQPILKHYYLLFKQSHYSITEIIHIPLFYGSFREIHNRMKPYFYK